jgi:hypothetical protein
VVTGMAVGAGGIPVMRGTVMPAAVSRPGAMPRAVTVGRSIAIAMTVMITVIPRHGCDATRHAKQGQEAKASRKGEWDVHEGA